MDPRRPRLPRPAPIVNGLLKHLLPPQISKSKELIRSPSSLASSTSHQWTLRPPCKPLNSHHFDGLDKAQRYRLFVFDGVIQHGGDYSSTRAPGDIIILSPVSTTLPSHSYFASSCYFIHETNVPQPTTKSPSLCQRRTTQTPSVTAGRTSHSRRKPFQQEQQHAYTVPRTRRRRHPRGRHPRGQRFRSTV